MLTWIDVEMFKEGARREQRVTFHYVKRDGSGRRRRVKLQPPINPPRWFTDDRYVFGIDLDKDESPPRVQIWAFDGISRVTW